MLFSVETINVELILLFAKLIDTSKGQRSTCNSNPILGAVIKLNEKSISFVVKKQINKKRRLDTLQTESANNILLSGDRQRAEKRCVISNKLIVREIDLQKLILGGHICWESGEGVICCNEEAHRWPWRRNNAGEFVSGDLKSY